jgi:hypothetical protein
MSYYYIMSSLGPPIITNINNGVLSGMRAMPAKDINATGSSSFSMSRRRFNAVMPLSVQSNEIQQEKKWYGNRDASQVTANARVAEIGIGTTNSNLNPFSYKSSSEKNTQRQALNRTRGGGAVVPLKKTNSTKIF